MLNRNFAYLLLFTSVLYSCSKNGKGNQVGSVSSPRRGELVDFGLLDQGGKFRNLYYDSDASAIIFVGASKRFVRIEEDDRLLRKVTSEGKIRAYFINPVDDRTTILRQQKDLDLKTPTWMDSSQMVTAELGIRGPGDGVLIDPKQWKILARGSAASLVGFLNGNTETKAAEVDPFPLRKLGKIDYSENIAPLLRKKCLNCHSEKGKYKPYFADYHSVLGWAAMIKETVMKDTMPPFSADPLYSKYSNDISLTPVEKASLITWMNSGLPRGQGVDSLSEGPIFPAKRVKIPKIVWEVGMEKPEKIGPKGTLEYLYLQIGGPAPRDMWITGVNTISTNPQQLHHSSIIILPRPWKFYENRISNIRRDDLVNKSPDGDIPMWAMEVIRQIDQGVDDNFVRFGAWAAGRSQPYFLRDQTAIFIPKGYYVVLEVHYLGNGKEDEEQTKIQFYGYPEGKKPAGLKRIRYFWTITTEMEIPPGTRDFVVPTKSVRIQKNMRIVTLLAHLHMRGTAARLIMTDPQGRERIVTSIPNFDFNWQSGAKLEPDPPIFVPAGSRLRAECTYDNSAQNPRNPDPEKFIKHGQTLDRAEMCKFMIAYYEE